MTPTFWWMGAAVFLTGIAVNLGGTSLQQPLLEQLGMLACANGVVMAAAGRSVYRAVWYPLAFLVLMLPLPSGAHEALISPLRELTAQVSATLLETLGVPTVSSGQVMSIGGPDSTAVIEAAGGLRMVLALLIVIGVGAFIIERPRWQKVVVVLSSVPIALACNALRIVAAGEVLRRGLQEWFGIAEPRLALCALNPHAGEGGLFGHEEQRVLAPAARQLGIAGPLPADTVFVRAMRGEFDAVLAPYHDVGMTAIKVSSFGKAVNVTLGLPVPRTAPDHGTALDIAGRGLADPASMREAVALAVQIARRVMGDR
jgi:exosortase